MPIDTIHTLTPDTAAAIALSPTVDSATLAVDTPATDTAQSWLFMPGLSIDSLSSLHRYYSEQLAEQPAQRYQGNEMPPTPVGDTGVMLLLLLTFVAVAISYKRGEKYLSHLIGSLTRMKERNSIFDDTTINETQLRVSLLLLTFVTQGMAIYYGAIHAQAPTQALVFPLVLCCTLLCGLYYLLQRGIYRLLGLTFADARRTALFDESFVTVYLLGGIFLAAPVLAMMFLPGVAAVAVWLCVVVYILMRLFIIFSGIRIFSPQGVELLYIILYLCALEIVPLLLIAGAIPLMYQFVEFNLLEP